MGDGLACEVEADESTPRLAPENPSEEVNDNTYGPLKVACEDEATRAYGEKATIAATPLADPRPTWRGGDHERAEPPMSVGFSPELELEALRARDRSARRGLG